MFSYLSGSCYIISILYCCPNFYIVSVISCFVLLRAVAGHSLADFRYLLEVFGSNDIGRETSQPDSLLTHAIDASLSSIYLYLSSNGTAFYA